MVNYGGAMGKRVFLGNKKNLLVSSRHTADRVEDKYCKQMHAAMETDKDELAYGIGHELSRFLAFFAKTFQC